MLVWRLVRFVSLALATFGAGKALVSAMKNRRGQG